MGFGFFGFGRKKTDKKQDEQKEQIPKELAAYRAAVKTEEEQGFEAAKDMYIMAAENGSREACVRLSTYLEEKDETFFALILSQCAADLGDGESAYKAGLALQAGLEADRDDRSAFYMFRKAANAGHIESQYLLASMYYRGIGTAEDLKQAALWAHRAADAGHIEAQYLFGMLRGRGEGVEMNTEDACGWLKKAAAQGHAGAIRMLQALDEKKLTGQKTGEKSARAVAQECVRKLSVEEQYRQGMESYETEDYVKAFVYLKECFSTSEMKMYPDALAALGKMYEQGLGTWADPRKAQVFYLLACDKNNVLPYMEFCALQNFPSVMDIENVLPLFEKMHAKWQGDEETCQNMEEIKQELQKTKEGLQGFLKIADMLLEEKQNDSALAKTMRYRIAARLGSGKAVLKLAERPDIGKEDRRFLYEVAANRGCADAMYLLSKECEGDHLLLEWTFWLLKAEQEGSAAAQCTLGRTALSENQDEKAMEYFEKAAEQNYPDALLMCHGMYEQGRGTEKDKKKAMWYLQRAAEQGSCRAQVKYAYLLETGDGVEKNPAQAVEWYRKAALNEENSEIAWYAYGRVLHEGIGCRKNQEKAAFWLEKAAEKGHNRSQYMIGSMYADGEGVPKNIEMAKKWLHKACWSKDYKISSAARNKYSRLER